jgi:hypothetical protein
MYFFILFIKNLNSLKINSNRDLFQNFQKDFFSCTYFKNLRVNNEILNNFNYECTLKITFMRNTIQNAFITKLSLLFKF